MLDVFSRLLAHTRETPQTAAHCPQEHMPFSLSLSRSRGPFSMAGAHSLTSALRRAACSKCSSLCEHEHKIRNRTLVLLQHFRSYRNLYSVCRNIKSHRMRMKHRGHILCARACPLFQWPEPTRSLQVVPTDSQHAPRVPPSAKMSMEYTVPRWSRFVTFARVLVSG